MRGVTRCIPDGRIGTGKGPGQPSGKWGIRPCENVNFGENTMRKLLIASVSVLALSAGAAYADPNAVENQYSGIGTVAVPGSAPLAAAPTVYGNSSTVQQIGSGNTVGGVGTYGVDQLVGNAGSANSSTVKQGNSTHSSAGASASVTQHTSSGGLASSLINQDNAGAATTTTNSATVTQIITGGTGTTAGLSTINQSGNGLQATVTQGASAAAVHSVSSYVGQAGTGGKANVNQTVSGAQSVVLQNGTAGSVATGTGYNVDVQQTSGTNTSGVSQESISLGAVTVNQSGTGTNNSQVWQTAAATASVQQAGNSNNQSALSQTAAGTANVYQTGTGSANLNMSAINQGGTGTINVYQGYDLTGSTPAVTAATVGASTNYSGVTQNGAGTVGVYQSGATGLTNLSTIDQQVTSDATVWQTANLANNTSTITQNGGTGNTANVKQH